MTTDTPSPEIEPIVDYERLSADDPVPYHEQRDVVDRAVVDRMRDLPDLACVGITNPAGELLLRQQTDTCSWKIPVESVTPDEAFTTAIVDHVRATIEGVWQVTVETDGGERTATRGFVTFGGVPMSGAYDLTAVEPAGEPVHAVEWFDELPADADVIPGTDVFLD
ncbi:MULTISPECIES: hypothetical protein [Halomicrobium]|uniref:Uncharacterized protein n=2 Tax=Halomicrobium mukohataei TaxID=57705 RepID=C7NYS6_HALMD|nr:MULTISPECIES: hypothetical protein [Halomicrobium]ACV48615.1 hypothetical protein Hmuk_2507 [Halomicrobium mukohataei DSM 12286]QCD67012.1 hypothetical protein E5139_15670 [Halomicrobium mukohataei]QFR21822.1 hypothetical protein GBQ70_15690 [Halomicrobium sp. ZPS1]